MAFGLYRSRNDRILAGVCGGLGHYLSVDSTLVRVFFLLLALGRGIGVLVYLAMWYIMPYEDRTRRTGRKEAHTGASEIAQRAWALGEEVRQAVRSPRGRAGPFVGLILIGVGVLLLLQALKVRWLWWLSFDVLWPVLIILAGALLLLRRTQRG